MIVIVVRFETDGDYFVDNKAAGLTSPPDDDYSHGGIFLCADTDEAEAVLLRVVQSVTDKGNWYGGIYQDRIFSWLTSAVNEALHLLRKKSEILRHGWLRLASGNYEGTMIFMQEARDFRGEPTKPVFQENDDYQCELNHCPTCGHIVEGVESGERFVYCPQCGQRIDWDGAARDALDGKGGAAP